MKRVIEIVFTTVFVSAICGKFTRARAWAAPCAGDRALYILLFRCIAGSSQYLLSMVVLCIMDNIVLWIIIIIHGCTILHVSIVVYSAHTHHR